VSQTRELVRGRSTRENATASTERKWKKTKRLLSLFAVLGVALFGGSSAAGAASPGSSDVNALHYYVSLGDSLAASEQPNGDSADGYAEQLFAKLKANDPTLRLVKLGCSGETTHSMIFRNPCGYAHGSQLAEAVSFLHAHRQLIRLVTIDIGADDVFLCIFNGDQGCLGAALPAASTNLTTTLTALRNAAGTEVPILGMNYYDPFLAFWFFSPAAAQLSEQMVMQLNDVLGSVYSAAGDPVADVGTAFSTTDGTLVGGVPLNVLRICQWTWMCTGNPDVHPNTTGYGVIAEAFEDALP
jgi:lysophospholipase L1-like esterase